MRFEKIRFSNPEGDALAARLDLPEVGEPIAYAIFAHCFTCTKNLRAVGAISESLTRQGLGVLRFDFTGLGESEGDFADTNFSSNIEDLLAAARYLEETYGAPKLLVGHSLGGAAVLMAAGRLPSVTSVVTIAAPYDPAHVKGLFASSIDDLEEDGVAEVSIGGRPFTIKKRFIDDLEGHRVKENLAHLGRALLLFHSPTDQIVGIDNARRIFLGAKHPKSFVSLDGADHLLTAPADSNFVGQVLGAWVCKYLNVETQPVPDPVETTLPVAVRTQRTRYTSDVKARHHTFVADEPESLGGKDRGPTPYELLLAALGACKTITMRMYADRKGWPMDEAIVHLKHASEAMGKDDSGKTLKRDRFETHIELRGDLSEDQRERLLEIAERCPVHRTLLNEHTAIDSQLYLVETPAN